MEQNNAVRPPVNNETTRRIQAAIQAQLDAAGYSYDVTPKNTLRMVRSVGDKPFAAVHIAVAESFIGDAVHDQDDACEPLWEYHFDELSEDVDKRLDTYLLLVGDDEYIHRSEFGYLLEALPLNADTAKKHICGLSEVMAWVANPFSPWATPASDAPVIYTVRERNPAYDDPAPRNDANLMFHPPQAGFKPDIPVEQMAEVQALTAHLLRRILGAAYRVEWPDSDGEQPCVGRSGGELPLWYVSNSERLVFALALFLAQAYVSRQAGLYVHIPNVLGQLDSLRRLTVLDCLRDFLMATGASLYFESNKSDVVTLAYRKMSKLPGSKVTE